MSNSAADLTEKEKEALRLLSQGHDAKSSASHLDISVHTINDRLRNARRKLGVSSSREAARILWDAEGNAPQIDTQYVMHTSFGMADETGLADYPVLNQHSQKQPNRLFWLAGGMLIMSIIIAVAVFAAVSNTGAEDAPSATDSRPAGEPVSSASTSSSSPAALARAQKFLVPVDAGDWTRSWEVAGAFFQAQASADEWAALVGPVRGPLGAVDGRRLATIQKVESLPGAPEGDYEILTYQTKFSQEDRILTETVILVRNGDGFDIAGYFIR